jgi:predicted transcriptional regulator
MRERKIGALPVVRDDQLVGIITQHDFIDLAGQLLEKSNKGTHSNSSMSESSASGG